ncbi:MAG: dephospho-CoA kinase [Rickettsiales bacterium]|nr:dephospho-CoA kinase [Rickettsiales bacterium]
MKIIGLTGGIASGKNFVAEIFAQNGAAVFDADFEVHQLFASDKSVIAAVMKNFPDSFVEGKIERKILGKIVFSDAKKLEILEKILHPKVREKYQEFLANAQKSKKKIAVLNIPLLLETQGYKCDKIVAIVASPSIQKRRFLARHKKTTATEKKNLEKKFEQIRSKQISNSERKSGADFVVNSGGSKRFTVEQVEKIIKTVSSR